MKKIYLYLLLLINATVLFSADYSSEKILSITQYQTEYDYLNFLYLEVGLTSLSHTYPFTVNEFNHYIQKLERRSVFIKSSSLYIYLKNFLEKKIDNSRSDILDFNLNFTINTELYANTNKEINNSGTDLDIAKGLVDSSYYFYNYKKRKPFLDLTMDGLIGSHVAFSSTVPLKKDRIYTEFTKDNYTNIIYSVDSIDIQIPQRGFISFGTDHLTGFIGRDKFSIGNGYSGKMHLSDAADYHDGLRLSTYWEDFKYTFHFISLDSILIDNEVDKDMSELLSELYKLEDEEAILKKQEEIYELNKYNSFKSFMSHTFEFTPLDNLGFSLTESVVFGKRIPELRDLNPFLLYHNSMIDRSSFVNALMTFEAEYTPIRRLRLYGSITLDQYATSVENDRWEQTDPNALGYMLGAEYILPINLGFLNFGIEGVKTDPFLYIDDSDMSFSTTRRIASLIDNSDYRHAEGIPYTDPLGFKAGNDVLLLNVRASCQFYNGLFFKLENETLVKGDNTLLSDYLQGSDALDMSTPSGDEPEIINSLTLSCKYPIFDYLKAESHFSWVYIGNFKDSGENLNDFQVALSLSYTL